jgi:hypothetical protein
MPGTDLVATVSAPDADELIAHAGIIRADAGWLLPNGTRNRDPATVLTNALAMIAQECREGRYIDLDAEAVEWARVGLTAVLAEPSLPERSRDRANALLGAIDVGAAEGAAPVVVDLARHRLTLLIALQERVEMLGHSDEENELCGKIVELELQIERRAFSDVFEGRSERWW